MNAAETPEDPAPGRPKIHWSVWSVAAVGALLLVVDHWAHVLGVLPYLVLLACPLMHVFMHRGHGDHGHGKSRGGHADGQHQGDRS